MMALLYDHTEERHPRALSVRCVYLLPTRVAWEYNRSLFWAPLNMIMGFFDDADEAYTARDNAIKAYICALVEGYAPLKMSKQAIEASDGWREPRFQNEER